MTERNKATTIRRRLPGARIFQGYRLVWVDGNFNASDGDCQNTLQQLRAVVNDVQVFTESDACENFLREVTEEKVFVITSGSLGKDLISRIHSLPQVDTIYIFCDNRERHKPWTEQWSKVKDVYTQIEAIREALQQSVKQCNQESTPMSFVPFYVEDSAVNLDQLEPSFMYTQLFKNALLQMEHDGGARKDLVKYCREQKADFPEELRVIDEFEREYRPDRAIWWYTRECFTYQMLNRALRLLESDIIVDMGFFIHDLNRQIEQLHDEQVAQYDGSVLMLYRAQRLSTADFEKLKKIKGGLLSFNSFVSTTKDREVAKFIADSSSQAIDGVGILFSMTIDSTLTSTPFADIASLSHFTEAEVLFSMHSVFRVDQVMKLDDQERLFEVRITLTADDDPQLRLLTSIIDQEVEGSTGWDRIGLLLIKVGQLQKAEELYNRLLTRDTNLHGMTQYNHQLGRIKADQGDYKGALSYYETSLDIQQKILPANHPNFATPYNDIASVYSNMGEYSKALSYYQKCLDIQQKSFPANHPNLATSYNNIGLVYTNMGEYSKALSNYEKSLDIKQKSLPANHPSLAITYNNLGSVYEDLGEYSKALSYYQKCLDIKQKSLPENHSSLATSYSNIGSVYEDLGEYSKALSHYEKSLDIRQNSLPANHPGLATSYNDIGSVYNKMGEYSKALSCHERSLDIQQKTLPANHPDLAASYGHIGSVFKNMGENSKALSNYEKCVDIKQKSLPDNHSSLATAYNNIGSVYESIRQYSKALSYFERCVDIRQKSLPANHPDLATSYNNIGSVFRNMGEYSKALSYHEKCLDIQQKTLPADHPDLAGSYTNIATVYYSIGDYSKALPLFQRALDTWQRSLPPNHPNFQIVLMSIAMIKNKL